MASPGRGATSRLRKPLQHSPKIETITRKLIPFSLPEFPFLHQLRRRVLSSRVCRNARRAEPGSRRRASSRAAVVGDSQLCPRRSSRSKFSRLGASPAVKFVLQTERKIGSVLSSSAAA